MTQLLSSPFAPKFDGFINSLKENCFICSPYITVAPVKRLVSVLEKKHLHNKISVKILTDLSGGNIVLGSTDLDALIFLKQKIRNSEIVYLPRIHAKIYISDESLAIISSANFTDGGAFRNFEYGVQLNDPSLIRQVSKDITEYSTLGTSVNLSNLSDLQNQVQEIRSVVREEHRSITKKLRSISIKLQRKIEEDLIRIRTYGKTAHAIFAETILYLLSRHDMGTNELNQYIGAIHTDLCDDNLELIIDGKHFGKSWKHQVRSAQVFLKRKRAIEYDSENRIWKLAKS